MPCGLYFSSYVKDDAIFKTVWLKFWMVAFLIFIFAVPLFSDAATTWLGFDVINHLIMICIYVVGAHGLNLLTGFTGQISLGHAAFMGVGAYTAGVLANAGVPFYFALPLAGLMSAAVGMIFGIPSLRLRGLYLAIATMAAQFILVHVMRHWEAVTGGSSGLNVPRPAIGGFELESDVHMYYLCLVVAVLTTMYVKNLTRTRTGRAFVAVRDRYLSAEVIGVNLFKYRILSFGISSFLVGVAGALYAYHTSIVSDEAFTIGYSVEYLAFVIVGGLGHVLGAIFGTAFMYTVPTILGVWQESLGEIFPSLFADLAHLRELIFGLLVIGFLVFEPDGLAARWHTIRNYWKLWPFSY
jgi:branched-chain amino acid transport system permease protein